MATPKALNGHQNGGLHLSTKKDTELSQKPSKFDSEINGCNGHVKDDEEYLKEEQRIRKLTR